MISSSCVCSTAFSAATEFCTDCVGCVATWLLSPASSLFCCSTVIRVDSSNVGSFVSVVPFSTGVETWVGAMGMSSFREESFGSASFCSSAGCFLAGRLFDEVDDCFLPFGFSLTFLVLLLLVVVFLLQPAVSRKSWTRERRSSRKETTILGEGWGKWRARKRGKLWIRPVLTVIRQLAVFLT